MRALLAGLFVVALLAMSGAATADTPTVKVGDDFFAPKKVTITKGKTLHWTWGDGTKHKHTVTEEMGRFTSKKKKQGTYKHRFSKAGTFHIVCAVHDDMTMKVTVKKP
jgi:plastocyanin